MTAFALGAGVAVRELDEEDDEVAEVADEEEDDVADEEEDEVAVPEGALLELAASEAAESALLEWPQALRPAANSSAASV